MKGKNLFVKSGVDFKNLSVLTLEERELNEEEKARVPEVSMDDDAVETGKTYSYQVRDKFAVNIKKCDITKDLDTDPEVEESIQEYYRELDKKMSRAVNITEKPLDIRFKSVRSRETLIGNFVCDLIQEEVSANCAFMNSGNFRADNVYKPGEMNIGDWHDIFPYDIGIVKLSMTGKQIREVLEVGVSKYPSLEGRFLQVSSLYFVYDPELESGQRIIGDVYIGSNRRVLKDEETYTAATVDYIANGNDGFDVLKECEQLIDHENSQMLKNIILKFMKIAEDPEMVKEIEKKDSIKQIIGDEQTVKESARRKTQNAFTKLKMSRALISSLKDSKEKEAQKKFRRTRTINRIDENVFKMLESNPEEKENLSAVLFRR